MEKRRGRREIEVSRRRRGGIKRGESKLASNHFPMCSPVWTTQRCSWSYTEERRGRKETEVARRIKGGIKRRETVQPVISSLSVLHSPEHTKRFTELGRKGKGEEGDRGDVVGKKESPKGKRAVKLVISLPSKNGYRRLGSSRYKIDKKYQKAKIKNLEYGRGDQDGGYM